MARTEDIEDRICYQLNQCPQLREDIEKLLHSLREDVILLQSHEDANPYKVFKFTGMIVALDDLARRIKKD